MKQPATFAARIDSVLAQQNQCKRDSDDCRFNCKRCKRGREYSRRHGGES